MTPGTTVVGTASTQEPSEDRKALFGGARGAFGTAGGPVRPGTAKKGAGWSEFIDGQNGGLTLIDVTVIGAVRAVVVALAYNAMYLFP